MRAVQAVAECTAITPLPEHRKRGIGYFLLARLTQQSRKRNVEATMAFVRQNGWCLYQPIWGECHAFRIVDIGQVFQPHRVHAALFRSRHLQRTSGHGASKGTQTLCRLRAPRASLSFRQGYRATMLRISRGTCPTLGTQTPPHLGERQKKNIPVCVNARPL